MWAIRNQVPGPLLFAHRSGWDLGLELFIGSLQRSGANWIVNRIQSTEIRPPSMFFMPPRIMRADAKIETRTLLCVSMSAVFNVHNRPRTILHTYFSVGLAICTEQTSASTITLASGSAGKSLLSSKEAYQYQIKTSYKDNISRTDYKSLVQEKYENEKQNQLGQMIIFSKVIDWKLNTCDTSVHITKEVKSLCISLASTTIRTTPQKCCHGKPFHKKPGANVMRQFQVCVCTSTNMDNQQSLPIAHEMRRKLEPYYLGRFL